MPVSRASLSPKSGLICERKSGLICVVVIYVCFLVYLVNYFHITAVNERLVPNSSIFYRTQKPAPRNISLMPSRLSSNTNASHNGLHRQSKIVVQNNGSSGSDVLLTGNSWNNKQVRGEGVHLNALNERWLSNNPLNSSLQQRIAEPVQAAENETVANVRHYKFWERIDAMITNDSLYSEDFNVSIITNVLRYAKLIKADLLLVRTSYKWNLHLQGGQRILFKPKLVNMTHRRDSCGSGCEHPEYEIAGFTINRLLGYRNFPFTTGRILSWTKDVLPVATPRLKEQMETTPGNKDNYKVSDEIQFWPDPTMELAALDRLKKSFNLRTILMTCWLSDGDVCFKSQCWGETVNSTRCFKNGNIPGAMVYYLRKKIVFKHEEGEAHHQFRPGSKFFKDHLLNLPGDNAYCGIFRNLSDYSKPRDFGDFLDATVLSYITHHRDQKITVIRDGHISLSVMFDFGLAFCPHYTILLAAPIYQCCLIRRATYERLTELKTSLPLLFQDLTRGDPLYPLLQPGQIMKVAKRIRMLLSLADYCIELRDYQNVVREFL